MPDSSVLEGRTNCFRIKSRVEKVRFQLSLKNSTLGVLSSINQSIKTHFYSAICRERIRGAWWRKL